MYYLTCMCFCRKLLVFVPDLREKQKQCAEAVYIDALSSLIRLRNQSMVADAEHALNLTLPAMTRRIASAVKSSLAKHQRFIGPDTQNSLSRRCDELISIVGIADDDEISEQHCLRWRTQLQRHIFE
jgi:hypothetical protein